MINGKGVHSMRDDSLGNIEVKKEIYLNLAEFLNEPDAKHYNLLVTGKFEEIMQELFIKANYQYPKQVSFTNIFENEDEMQEAYFNCISGHVKSTTLPVESCFKPWTTDNESDMYNLKGYLLGDSAEHVKYLFGHYNLELPTEFLSAPDHLILLLEFLSFLIERRSNDEVVQFLIDHFDWLPELQRRLAETTECLFYQNLITLIINATTDELNYLNELRGENIEN